MNPVLVLPRDADNERALLALELNAGIGDLDVIELDVPWTAEFGQGPAVKALTVMRDRYRTGFYTPGFDSTKQEDAVQRALADRYSLVPALRGALAELAGDPSPSGCRP